MTTLFKGHIGSVCRSTDNNAHGFVRFSSMTPNFLDNTCTKIQNMAFKTSQMNQIALEYWYYGFLRRLRVDGRGFLHQPPILKNCSPEQKSSCRTCAEAYHSPFNLYRKLYHLSSWQPNYNSISNVIFITSIVSLILFEENTGKVMLIFRSLFSQHKEFLKNIL